MALWDVLLYVILCVILISFSYRFYRLSGEVYDCGEYLLIKKWRTEEKIFFKDIENVTSLTMSGVTSVTLHLVLPGKLGASISFIPNEKIPLYPTLSFKNHQVAERIIRRVNIMRRSRDPSVEKRNTFHSLTYEPAQSPNGEMVKYISPYKTKHFGQNGDAPIL